MMHDAPRLRVVPTDGKSKVIVGELGGSVVVVVDVVVVVLDVVVVDVVVVGPMPAIANEKSKPATRALTLATLGTFVKSLTLPTKPQPPPATQAVASAFIAKD